MSLTRAERLECWRLGYEAGYANGLRQDRHRQRVIESLIRETVHVLAKALLEGSGDDAG